MEPKPDGEVADARRVALEDVERRRRAASPKMSPFIGAARRASPGDAHLVRRPRRAEDAEVGLDRRGVGARARRARSPTSWTITSEPRSSAADPERADREHGDQRRDGDPRPLAPVEPRAGRGSSPGRRARCSRTGARAAPPIGGSARLGRFDDRARRSSESSASDTVPPDARRQQAAPERGVAGVALGDPGRRGVEAEQRHRARCRTLRSAAITRSPEVASDAPGAGVAGVGGQRRRARPGRPPRSGRRTAGSTSRMPVGPVGEQVVGEAGQRVRAGGAADDHEPSAAGDPACAGRRAAPGVSADASTSCQTSRSRAAQAWMRSGRSAGRERDDRRARAPFWLGSRSSSPTSLAGFSDTTPTTSWVWSWRAMATFASATTVSPLDQLDLHVAAEGRRLRVQEVLLARARSRAPPGSRTGSRSPTPPATRSSPVTVGPAFSRSTAIANHDPCADVALEQSARASIVRPSAAGDRRGRDQQRASSEQARRRAGAAMRARDGQARAAARGLLDSRLGRRSEHDARAAGKVARRRLRVARPAPPVAVRPRLSYDAWAPDPSVGRRAHARGARPRPSRAQRNPCPTSDRSARSATTPRSSADLGPRRRAAVRRHRRGPAPGAAGAPPAQRGAARPAARRAAARIPTSATGASARTLAAWRSDGTLRKDPQPVGLRLRAGLPRARARTLERTQRGFFARLRIEPFGPGGGGAARTSGRSPGPKEDRYRLLRATGINTSPVVGLYEDPARAAAADLARDRRRRRRPSDVTDDDGVRHRLWVVPDEGEAVAGAAADRAPPGRARCSSPTATTATRPRSATATSGA